MGQRMVMEQWGLLILDFARLPRAAMAMATVVAWRGNVDPSREAAACIENNNDP